MTHRIPDHFIRQSEEDFDDLNILYLKHMDLFDLKCLSPSGRRFDIDASLSAFFKGKPIPIIKLVPKIAGGIKFNLEQQIGMADNFGISDENIVRAQIKLNSGLRIAPDEAIAFEFSGSLTKDGLTVVEQLHSLRVEKVKDLK